MEGGDHVALEVLPQVVDIGVEERAADDATAEPGGAVEPSETAEGGIDQGLRGVRIGQVANPGDNLDGGPRRFEFGHHTLTWIADDEVVTSIGQKPGQAGPDVVGGVADKGDTTAHPGLSSGMRRPITNGPSVAHGR